MNELDIKAGKTVTITLPNSADEVLRELWGVVKYALDDISGEYYVDDELRKKVEGFLNDDRS